MEEATPGMGEAFAFKFFLDAKDDREWLVHLKLWDFAISLSWEEWGKKCNTHTQIEYLRQTRGYTLKQIKLTLELVACVFTIPFTECEYKYNRG